MYKKYYKDEINKKYSHYSSYGYLKEDHIEETFCPYCKAIVSRKDYICRKCGFEIKTIRYL